MKTKKRMTTLILFYKHGIFFSEPGRAYQKWYFQAQMCLVCAYYNYDIKKIILDKYIII